MISLLQIMPRDRREIDDRVLCATSARSASMSVTFFHSASRWAPLVLNQTTRRSPVSLVNPLLPRPGHAHNAFAPWGNFNWWNWRIFNWRKVGNFQLALTNDDYGVAVAEAFAAAVLGGFSLSGRRTLEPKGYKIEKQ